MALGIGLEEVLACSDALVGDEEHHAVLRHVEVLAVAHLVGVRVAVGFRVWARGLGSQLPTWLGLGWGFTLGARVGARARVRVRGSAWGQGWG